MALNIDHFEYCHRTWVNSNNSQLDVFRKILFESIPAVFWSLSWPPKTYLLESRALRWLLLLMKITAFLVLGVFRKRNFEIKRCSAPLTLTFLFFSSPPWFPRRSWMCYMRQCDITARKLLLALIRILLFARFIPFAFFVLVCLLFYLLFNQVLRLIISIKI